MERSTEPYTDNDWMPYGKYGPKKNDPRQLKDVPANYLIWLHDNTEIKDNRLIAYIKKSWKALKMEHEDRV